jgi:hypothetical protein
VFSNVLPGLRELRAPLAAGYLWLTLVWLTLGDTLPTKTDVEGGPLERLYELEPVASDIGKAVVVSVAAYIIGSVAIDAQGLVRRWAPRAWSKPRTPSRGALVALESALVGSPEVQRWYYRRANAALGETAPDDESAYGQNSRDASVSRTRAELRSAAEGLPRRRMLALAGFLSGELDAVFDPETASREQTERRESKGLPPLKFGAQDIEQHQRHLNELLLGDEMRRWLVDAGWSWWAASEVEDLSDREPTRLPTPEEAGAWQPSPEQVEDRHEALSSILGILRGLPLTTEPAVRWIDANRDVVKTRLLDLSQSLHSEVDRPDAEATFRMGLWPPLAAMALYLAFAESPWWVLALALPSVLALQWMALRRTANDALVTAIAAKDQTRAMLIAGAYGTRREPPPLSEGEAPGGPKLGSRVGPAAGG